MRKWIFPLVLCRCWVSVSQEMSQSSVPCMDPKSSSAVIRPWWWVNRSAQCPFYPRVVQTTSSTVVKPCGNKCMDKLISWSNLMIFNKIQVPWTSSRSKMTSMNWRQKSFQPSAPCERKENVHEADDIINIFKIWYGPNSLSSALTFSTAIEPEHIPARCTSTQKATNGL